jgi:uncharacterized protein YbdZ (MbtH family)
MSSTNIYIVEKEGFRRYSIWGHGKASVWRVVKRYYYRSDAKQYVADMKAKFPKSRFRLKPMAIELEYWGDKF